MGSKIIGRMFATRAGRLSLALALALSVLVGQTGAVAAYAYQQPTITTWYGGTASGLVTTGYRAIQIQANISDEGARQTVRARLWISINDSAWGPVGDYGTTTTRDVLLRTGAATYFTWGPYTGLNPATYCFWLEYNWLRTSGWVGLGQHVGCYTVA